MVEDHTIYNDADGKTRAVFALIKTIDAERHKHPKKVNEVINEATIMAQHGRLDDALHHVGYKNDNAPLDLMWDNDGNRQRRRE